MLRSSSLLVVLVAGLALSLDLEAIQRSAHFPASPSSSHAGHPWGSAANKRASVPRRLPEEGPVVAPGGAGGSPEERLYYRLLSARMARLLPTLLGEQQQGYPGQAALVPAFFDGDDDDGSAASHASGVQGEDASGDEAGDEQEADEVMMYLPKRRVIHSPADTRRKMPRQPSFAGTDSGPVYGVRKRVPAIKRRLGIQVAREEKRKRSTRRQLKDFSMPTEAAPLRRSKVPKTFGNKKTTPGLKDQTKPSRFSIKGEKGNTAGELGNSTAVHKMATSKVDKATAAGSAGKPEGRKYHIMKRSSDSTDEKVTGELRNIFGDDDNEEEKKRSEKKTLKKRENPAAALKGSDAADDSAAGNEGTSALATKDGAAPTSDEDKFKKWLLDEYYRTMALSFASMRRKRMATHRDTLDLRQVKRTAAAPSVVPVSGAAEEQFEAVEDKLRNIEDAMIAEAVALVRDGASDEAELRAINAGVASRLDAAYDLENVRQSLDHLQGTLETIRQQELQAALSDDDEDGVPNGRSAVGAADQAGEEDVEELAQGSAWEQLNDKRTAASAPASKRQEELLPEPQGCPAVEVVSSSCPAAVLSLSPMPALQQMLLDACQWHQICYVCGSYYGLGPQDCESGTGGSGSSQFTRLLVSELLLSQGKHGTVHTTCGEPCVAEFLLNH